MDIFDDSNDSCFDGKRNDFLGVNISRGNSFSANNDVESKSKDEFSSARGSIASVSELNLSETSIKAVDEGIDDQNTPALLISMRIAVSGLILILSVLSIIQFFLNRQFKIGNT